MGAVSSQFLGHSARECERTRGRWAMRRAVGSPRRSSRCSAARPAGAAGPYPSLGSCPVFPAAGLALAPRRPRCHRGGLEPGRLQGAARPAARPPNRLHRLPRRRLPPPRLRLAARLRLPLRGRRRRPPAAAGPLHRLRRRRATAARSRSRPAPRSRAAPADGDRHVLVVDRSACTLYELYRAFHRGSPRPHWNADSGAGWDLRSAARRPDGWTSADAAGLPIFPGLVRYDEVAAGHIDHAIRVTFASTRDAWSTPPPTAPATPQPAPRRRWACGCG